MVCHQCGSDNPNKNNFCGNCGTSLQKSPEPVLAEPVKLSSAAKNAGLTSLGIADTEPSEPAWKDPIKPPAYLNDVPVPKRPASVKPEEPYGRTTISGPSFLGLTDGEDADQTSYLLEDEQPSHAGRWLVFAVVIIAIFVGTGYFEWDNIKTGRLNVPFVSSANSQPQPRTTPAPIIDGNKPSAGTPSPTAPAQATPPATPQSDNADTDKLTTSEPGTSADKQASPAPIPTNRDSAGSDKVTTVDHQTDSSETESRASRQAKGADQQRAANSENDNAKGVAAQPKPKPVAASDPRQNKMLLLGEQYLYGRGVPQSCNQALVYFKSAADEGNAPAMAHLGAMYASGNCVTLNRVTAFQWLARAQNAEPSDQWLQRNMNMLWRDMTPQERAAINR